MKVLSILLNCIDYIALALIFSCAFSILFVSVLTILNILKDVIAYYF